MKKHTKTIKQRSPLFYMAVMLFCVIVVVVVVLVLVERATCKTPEAKNVKCN